MIFMFHEDAGKARLTLRGEEFKYLIKVRRHTIGDTIHLRNEKDSSTLYSYTLTHIGPREALLELEKEEQKTIKPTRQLHIGWCIIDPKSVEKVLPSLNEMGVTRISFISCDRSQKNFKIDNKRLYRILRASMQQCGRSEFMHIEFVKSIEEFLKANPQSVVLDFSDAVMPKSADFETVLIGCEGGFSSEERELLAKQRVYRFDTPLVLRSESAALAAAAKVLL